MEINWTLLAMIVSAIASAVIAFYAIKAHALTKVLRQKDTEHQQEIKDIFQAIVISNLLLSDTQGPDSKWVQIRIDKFKKMYSGTTRIFD